MLAIKNLSQLKKALADGHNFKIIAHYKHPDWSGQERCVRRIGATIMYTGIANNPHHPISLMNDGQGCYFNFGKAADWTFHNGTCTYNKVWKIQVI